jgi:hypothetical protein
MPKSSDGGSAVVVLLALAGVGYGVYKYLEHRQSAAAATTTTQPTEQAALPQLSALSLPVCDASRVNEVRDVAGVRYTCRLVPHGTTSTLPGKSGTYEWVPNDFSIKEIGGVVKKYAPTQSLMSSNLLKGLD